jgi:hypothetical protein
MAAEHCSLPSTSWLNRRRTAGWSASLPNWIAGKNSYWRKNASEIPLGRRTERRRIPGRPQPGSWKRASRTSSRIDSKPGCIQRQIRYGDRDGTHEPPEDRVPPQSGTVVRPVAQAIVAQEFTDSHDFGRAAGKVPLPVDEAEVNTVIEGLLELITKCRKCRTRAPLLRSAD